MIAIVSHDAGGAEILSSWVKRQSEECLFVLDGPAISIFNKKLGDIEICSLEDAIEKCSWLLCGTSWQSILERKAIKLAKLKSKKSIAYLDHWVNYSDRFIQDGISILPDEIWVADVEAEEIAISLFSTTKITLKSNPYFEDLKLSFLKFKKDKKKSSAISILYLCDPIGEHALAVYGNEKYWGYSEKEALLYFFDNLNVFGNDVQSIIIRPHPSEKENKYNWVTELYPIAKISTDLLLKDISEADVIVGGESMALVIGLFLGKRVISCIPPGGILCRLPQGGIEHMFDLVLNKK